MNTLKIIIVCIFILIFNIGGTESADMAKLPVTTDDRTPANYADSVKLIIKELKVKKEELKTTKFKK